MDQPGQHVSQTHAATAAGKPDQQGAFCYFPMLSDALKVVCTQPKRLREAPVHSLMSCRLADSLANAGHGLCHPVPGTPL